jgi:hypothetical protein
MAQAVSFRLPEELKRRIDRRAADEGTSATTLVVQLLDEGLAMRDHPGIVFRPGPSGRRAGVAGGPDVWEIISGVRHAVGANVEERLADATEQMSASEPMIRLAIAYAAAHPEEIEERIRANDAAAERVRELSEAREKLLA